MSSIWWKKDDPNIYLWVNSRWYRYDATLPPVGEGAMGMVFLGFDCNTNEKVAVKMLHQSLWDNTHIRERMKLEASIQINHPNVVRMIGFCEDASGRGPLFVLSEYVCGVTFKEHIHQLTNLNEREKYDKTVAEFIPVLDAVGHLHSLGIIHRDIKPANIMFQDGCNLKLMDLGIAKADHFFDAHLKGFIGTVPFAAPEQEVEDTVEAIVDERTDIYAVGVTLAFLLVDHFPLLASDRIPAKLKKIIVKATQETPMSRYQSAGDMRAALEAYIQSEDSGRNNKKIILWGLSVLCVIVLIVMAINRLINIY